jgi:DNA mismatch endonuclease (patch repair protein)
MDIWNKEKRSEVMSKIRSKNTKPEVTLRKVLFARGFRYRVNYKQLPGKPDIVFPKYKTAIFVHGCFWHGHDIGCIDSHIPKTNSNYWTEKIRRNKGRDENNMIKILSMGWKVLEIWDCEIQRKGNIESLIQKITDLLYETIPYQSERLVLKFYEEIEGNVTMVAESIIPYKKSK